jgi:hypothetical protein
MVINFSQGMRDGMNFAGCNEESRFTDRAGLVERSKRIRWEKCASGKEFAKPQQGELSREAPVLVRERTRVN